MDVSTIHQRYVGRSHTLDICSFNSRGDGADIGDGHMITDIILPFVGIVLISIVLAVAYG